MTRPSRPSRPSPRAGQASAWVRLVDGPWLYLVYLPFYVVPWFWRPPDAIDLIGSALCLAVFLTIYAWTWRLETSDRRLLIGAGATMLLAFALAPFGGNWSVITIYAAAMIGRLARPQVAGSALFVWATSLAGFGLATGQHWSFWAFALIVGTMVGIGTMSRRLLEAKHAALAAAQSEVRALAELAERERIARDLHDLLGRTLTVIAIKADLAVKLGARDSGAATAQMMEVAAVARDALTEVRAAVSGLHHASLSHELHASRVALAEAGVSLNVAGTPDAIAPQAGAVLAMALREGVTNVIRHAGAAACQISLSTTDAEARLMIADDGSGLDGREGRGLEGLRNRVAAAGGWVRLDGANGGTRLTAVVPLEPA